MEENPARSVETSKKAVDDGRSPWLCIRGCAWCVLLVTALLAIVSVRDYHIYTVVHWNLVQNASVAVASLENVLSERPNPSDDESLMSVRNSLEKIGKSGADVMERVRLYQWTRIAGLLSALFSFAFRPRWLGLIALPLGVAAYYLTSGTP